MTSTPARPDGRPTVFLHIGTPKSGTTYLQSRFSVNHERAADQGLLWPGPSWGRHVAAARDLRKVPDGGTPTAGGPWDRLAKEARGWGGDSVLISMEWLSSLTPHQVKVAVDSLSPARVEIICTARDLLRSFVAQGQEMSKNYRTWSWAQFVDEVLNDTGGPAHQTFWRQQDLARILERWLQVVPAENVHLVSLPPSGADPGILWERFCAVLGIDGSDFELPSSDNASLGVVSTVLMQRLNVLAASRGLSHPVYKRAVHKAVGVEILGPRRKLEEPIAVSAEMDEFLRQRSSELVDELKQFGVHLHGSWDDLVPAAPLRGRLPEEVTDSELLEVCLEALLTLAVDSTDETTRSGGVSESGPASDSGLRPKFARAGRRARGAVRRAGHRLRRTR